MSIGVHFDAKVRKNHPGRQAGSLRKLRHFRGIGHFRSALRNGKTSIRPQLFVDNAFDKRYVLKGAFFSGASYGRPRTFSVRMTVRS